MCRATGRPPQQAFEPRDLRNIRRFNRNLIVKKLIGTLHDAERRILSRFDAIVWIECDPRDVLISRFLYNFRHRPLGRQPELLQQVMERLRHKERDPPAVDLCALIDLGRELDGVDVLPVIEREQIRAAGLWTDLAERAVAIRYEELIDGDTSKLDSLLGVPVQPRQVDIPYPRNRVARTRSTGNWRHWFTPRDVAELKPRLRPIAFTPADWDDWVLSNPPRIDPAHGSGYIERLLAGD